MLNRLVNIIKAVEKKTGGSFSMFAFFFTAFMITVFLYSNGYQHDVLVKNDMHVVHHIMNFVMNVIVNILVGVILIMISLMLLALGKYLVSLGSVVKEAVQEEFEIEPNTSSKSKITFS